MQDDPDDVFTNVVDVSFNGRQDDFPGIGVFARRVLRGFNERQQMSDGFFHHPGALDHLGQKHFAGTEQVPDDIHPVHERSFDDLQRMIMLQTSLFGVFDDIVGDAFD